MANDEKQPDTNMPSPERQAKLEAAYERQKDTDAPYKNVIIWTLGELQWIMQQRRWSGEWNLPQDMQRANLSGAYLQYANLSGAVLNGTNLSGAVLNYADLSGAVLTSVSLSGAQLWKVNLTRAELSDANLSTAHLQGANLSETNLSGADLLGTHLFAIQGIPHWPTLTTAEQYTLYQEVTSATTTVKRLEELAWSWPGITMQEAIATNPNTPIRTLCELALHAPVAFLRNPVLPMLFLEDPHWLSYKDAQRILQALNEQKMQLTEADMAIVCLIERCAQADI